MESKVSAFADDHPQRKGETRQSARKGGFIGEARRMPARNWEGGALGTQLEQWTIPFFHDLWSLSHLMGPFSASGEREERFDIVFGKRSAVNEEFVNDASEELATFTIVAPTIVIHAPNPYVVG